MPLETYVSKFTNLRFEPAGLTDDPDVRMSQSIMDYIFRRLALDYLSFESRSALGIYSAEERQRHLETGSYEPVEETGSAVELIEDPAPLVEVRRARWSRSVALATVSRPRTPRQAEIVIADKRLGRRACRHPQARTSAELLEQITGHAVDSPLCMTCGTKMRPGWLLLRLRRLRQHQRLQLIDHGEAGIADGDPPRLHNTPGTSRVRPYDEG